MTDTRATWRSIRIRKIITAATVTAGNTGAAEPAAGLLADELDTPAAPVPADEFAGGDTEKGLGQDAGEGDNAAATGAVEGMEAGSAQAQDPLAV